MCIFEPMLSKLPYNCKNDDKFSHTLCKCAIEASHSIIKPTSQYYHHKQFILYIFGNALHIFHRKTHDNVIFPHKARRTISAGRRKRALQAFRCHCPRLTNDKTDFEFLMQNTFVDSQFPDYLEVKAFAFDKNLLFVSTKPSVPHAAASRPVLDFWYCSLHPKQIKP